MLTTDDKRFALTTEGGKLIALYATESDARTDGTYMAEKEPGTKVQLRELTATKVDGDNLTKEFVLKETYPLPEEKKAEGSGEKKEEGKPAEERAKEEEKPAGAGEGTKAEGDPDAVCCPECGKPWAPAAEFCPECGCRPDEKA